MKRDAKDYSLGQALNEEEFYVEEVCDHLFVGNHRGLDLAGLSIRFRALEEEVTSQKELTISLDVYKLLRNRLSALSSGINWETRTTQIGSLSRRETHGCMEAMLSSIPSCMKAQAEEEISQLSRSFTVCPLGIYGSLVSTLLF